MIYERIPNIGEVFEVHKNVMESIVEYVYNSHVVPNYQIKCNCAQCMSDTFALTLNHLPSKYATTNQEEVLIRTMLTDTQFRLDVVRELIKSIGRIETNPKHEIDRQSPKD